MNIFVGCSSRDVGNTAYNHAADEIGSYIARNGHNLVFGGSKQGLMGRVYSKVYGHSKVICTLAKIYEEEAKVLQASEEENNKSEVIITATINERKDAIFNLSDVLVFLPGGIGTVDEFMASLESRRSGEHSHPIIIVDVNNSFKKVLEVLEKIYAEELANPKTKELYYVAKSVEEAISAIETISK